MKTFTFFTGRMHILKTGEVAGFCEGEQAISTKSLPPMQAPSAKAVGKYLERLRDETPGERWDKALAEHTDPNAMHIYAKDEDGNGMDETILVI